jgi:hypothetical protein
MVFWWLLCWCLVGSLVYARPYAVWSVLRTGTSPFQIGWGCVLEAASLGPAARSYSGDDMAVLRFVCWVLLEARDIYISCWCLSMSFISDESSRMHAHGLDVDSRGGTLQLA